MGSKNKTQTAVINIVSFFIFINLTFRKLTMFVTAACVLFLIKLRCLRTKVSMIENGMTCYQFSGSLSTKMYTNSLATRPIIRPTAPPWQDERQTRTFDSQTPLSDTRLRRRHLINTNSLLCPQGKKPLHFR